MTAQRDPENHEQRLIREGKVVSAHDYLKLLDVNRQQGILLIACAAHVKKLSDILAAFPTTALPKHLKIPGLADTLAPLPRRNIPESTSCGLCEAGYPVDGGQHFAGDELRECTNRTAEEESQKRSASIIVNGKSFEWSEHTITAEQLTVLAHYMPIGGMGPDLTITYHHWNSPAAKDWQASGSLKRGESVKARDGMVFNVAFTGRA